MGDSFSAELWDSTADIYAAILVHPFVRGLTDGSLPQDAFTLRPSKRMRRPKAMTSSLTGLPRNSEASTT